MTTDEMIAASEMLSARMGEYKRTHARSAKEEAIMQANEDNRLLRHQIRMNEYRIYFERINKL